MERSDYVNCRIAAQALDFNPADHFTAKQLVPLDRFAQMAIVAAREALKDCGADPQSDVVRQSGAIVGVGVGGMHTLDDAYYRVYHDDVRRVHPLSVPRLMANAAASQVSMHLGLRGMTYSVASACASGTHAIGQAFQMVRSGATRMTLCGGSEACITPGTIVAWEALRVLAIETCRPFSRNRSGLVLGEGAAMLVLEEWDHAVARGATIHAEMLGFGGNADAGDLTSPDQDNVVAAMEMAIADAGLRPADIGYVNAHGTGTTMNDRVESAAIRAVFGDRPPPISSSKGVLGHSLGATGALEAVITAIALRDQIVPPTANCNDPDPDLGVDMVAEGPRATSFSAAISNSFAFGGLNAVLALGRA